MTGDTSILDPASLRTIEPRHRSSAEASPRTTAGRVRAISISVWGRRTCAARNKTPDVLIFAVRPLYQTSVPASRYRTQSSATNRWARAVGCRSFGDLETGIKSLAHTTCVQPAAIARSPRLAEIN
jgi:hypothetical protein